MVNPNESETPQPRRLIDRLPPQWAGEGAALLAMVLVALWAVLRPAPEVLPDFSEIERADVLKASFFEFLAPIVASENERVFDQRRTLLEIAPEVDDGRPLPLLDRHWMRKLSAEYELDWPGDSREETLALLQRRVDVVPEPLALVQAAKESGWGRSRFARQGNNLFGHWCYVRGCGIVPSRRNQDAAHEVAAFDSVRHSVRRYINNLNTHPSYLPLRRIREAEREANVEPRALSLADGLIRYSERREAYVEEIKQIIRSNRELIRRAMGEASPSADTLASADTGA
ncbi:glucosaminidase domain-containing protein [Wenzhouxiangella sp. EGI_FJ10409]|uniref:glucosaminidase domain-containing protein n=1 Tax=Wenzhouxiangella sp. EGI_FJ10409 TaxID=3243767 RepID=UPI0035D81383